jgi:hypothetical protein
MNWRRWVLVLHRDLGYFFTGVVVLYAISGIAVNHADDWNPNFIIDRRDVTLNLPHEPAKINEQSILANLLPIGEAENFRGFDFPSRKKVKVYLKNGDVIVDLSDGRGVLETIRRRPFLHQVNRLHLNPIQWWKVFSDLFAVGLVMIAVTGLFVARGRQGFLGRGKWLVGAGLLVPLAAMLVF